jgi:hypothetical protein
MAEQRSHDEEPEAKDEKPEAKDEKAEAKGGTADARDALPVSIWTWVGMVLAVYGVIVTGMGVSYVIAPETATATAQYNPSLWWGALMTLAGVIFLGLGRRERKASRS